MYKFKRAQKHNMVYIIDIILKYKITDYLIVLLDLYYYSLFCIILVVYRTLRSLSLSRLTFTKVLLNYKESCGSRKIY